MGSNKKLVGIYLTLETLKRLRMYAAKKFVSLSEVVENAVKEFLDRNNDKH
jgi:metal-responsive CopG/Arc/MetJ family transcriptional regulator